MFEFCLPFAILLPFNQILVHVNLISEFATLQVLERLPVTIEN
jgi:hypothetical protein